MPSIRFCRKLSNSNILFEIITLFLRILFNLSFTFKNQIFLIVFTFKNSKARNHFKGRAFAGMTTNTAFN